MRLLINKDLKAIRVVMTALTVSRLIKWWSKEADYASITDPFISKEGYQEYTRQLRYLAEIMFFKGNRSFKIKEPV